MKITDRIYLIPGVVANPYLLIDADGLTLIEAGFPGRERAILGFVEGLGFEPRDLKRILITHSDLDHIGSLAAVKAASGARVYASQIEAEAVAQGKTSRRDAGDAPRWRHWLNTFVRKRLHARAAEVEEIVRDGQVLPILGGLRVVASDGHTPGHTSYFAVQERVLFCGDSLITEHGIEPSRATFTWDMGLALQSAQRQAALNPHIVCSGHGPPVIGADGK